MEIFTDKPVKTGMVAIVGPPNAGKSTLLNTLLGEKISIVTPKPQTTRNRILGIMNHEQYQILLLDTPGLHQARLPFNEEMVRIAKASLTEVDVILFLIDACQPLAAENSKTFVFLKDAPCPVILVLNKIDLLAREQLLPIIDTCRQLYPFAAIVPLSALRNRGTDSLLAEMLALLPVGPRLYPEDIPTDVTERFIVAEIIREKIFLLTGQEVPYATAVIIDSFKEDDRKDLVTIHATIVVEKGSQKGIIIGRAGTRLGRIGKSARADIEGLLGRQVLLKLWVRVRKNWTKDMRFIRELEML